MHMGVRCYRYPPSLGSCAAAWGLPQVLGAWQGGTIDLHGRQVVKRWTKLAAGQPALANTTTLRLAESTLGWWRGTSAPTKVMITSTTYNWKQAEILDVSSISADGTTITLATPLAHSHSATVATFAGSSADIRAEVAFLSSNIEVTSLDGPAQRAAGGGLFGARFLVHKASTLRLSNVLLSYCGQGGFGTRGCLVFDGLSSVANPAGDGSQRLANPSFLKNSVILYGLSNNVRVSAGSGGISIIGNVMYESYEESQVVISGEGNVLRNNLAVGMYVDNRIKPAPMTSNPRGNFFLGPTNIVEGNVAGGCDRIGFSVTGLPCTTGDRAGSSFRDNVAHSVLVGAHLKSGNAGCTKLEHFLTHTTWDFGVITPGSTITNTALVNVSVVDPLAVGVELLSTTASMERSEWSWRGGMLVGRSSPDVCDYCPRAGMPGCAANPSVSSYTVGGAGERTPIVGLYTPCLSGSFMEGPDGANWDGAMAYMRKFGVLNVSGVTLANWGGASACECGAYALASQPACADVAYPSYFSSMTLVNVPMG